MNFSNTAFDQAFNYYLKAELHLGTSYNGIIKAMVGLLAFISNMTLSFWIMKKTNIKTSMFTINILCSMISFIIVGTIALIPFVVLNICLYICNYISIPVLQNVIVKEAKTGQENLVIGFYNSFKSLGGIFGSALAGTLYEKDPKYPFLCSGLFYSFAVICCAFSIYYSHKKVTEN